MDRTGAFHRFKDIRQIGGAKRALHGGLRRSHDLLQGLLNALSDGAAFVGTLGETALPLLTRVNAATGQEVWHVSPSIARAEAAQTSAMVLPMAAEAGAVYAFVISGKDSDKSSTASLVAYDANRAILQPDMGF